MRSVLSSSERMVVVYVPYLARYQLTEPSRTQAETQAILARITPNS